MAAGVCTRCGRKLTKIRLAANKRKCYPCECAVKREQKQRAHDWRVESEDFTAADYWQLYNEQGGRCAILACRATGKTKHLSVEHDHGCTRGHDPKKWCRDCVRGLTCGPHNEWIGRAGDDPAVFDSIANYLRDPPARKTLMDKMIAGPHDEIIGILHDDYRIPYKRARKMLDMARGVGPSPTPIPDGTITIRYIRVPRSKKVLYEIIESAPRMDSELALKRLMDEYGLSERRSKTILNNAWRDGKRKVSTPNGIVRVEYHGRGANKSYMFSVEGD
jgi:hypothetical protein